MHKLQKTKAFTLIELMFATVILGVVGIALTSFMISSAKSISWSIRKARITSEFRNFTGLITQDALNSNRMFLYNSFDPGDFNPAGRRARGLSGDCLVLISYQPIPAINSPRFYQKLIVYNRDDRGSLFRREFTFTNPNILDETDAEVVVNAQRNNFSEPRLMFERTIGNSNGQFFFRVNEITFMIHGDIIYEGNIQDVTNTYNLTISTGG